MTESVTGKLIADKYRVETLLREGPDGDLYSGRHEVLDKAVTIKVLPRALGVDPRWTKRFINEARAASAITHPNVLGISDFGTDARGMSYAVFESLPDRNLLDVIATDRALEPKRALDIASQIASGLSAAHAKKLIHGRLDPADIFVATAESGREEIKVYGFGGDPLGAKPGADPRYLAPEQLTHFPVADERTDVYALGVMLYEMLSGAAPYEGGTAAEVLNRQSSEPPPPLSAFRKDLDPGIEPMILSAMAIAPERRYPTVTAFQEDLQRLLSRLGAPVAASAAAGRNVWRAAFVVLAGIALLSVALIYATSVRQTDPTTQLQADAGSLPVQPVGPASGIQEEALARRPVMTDDEIKAAINANTAAAVDQLPGGDGYNPWASGGPPAGAPPPQYIPPGGQTVQIEPGGGSQFMPQESGTVLYTIDASGRCVRVPSMEPIPCPANAPGRATPKPAMTPKPEEENPATKPSPTPAKTTVTPPDANRPVTNRSTRQRPGAKPAPTKKPEDILEHSL